MRIGILAALPGELKPLVGSGWQRMPVARGSGVRMWQTSFGRDDVVAVCAGIGAAAALRAFTAAEHAGSLDLVISVGWAGALVETLLPGAVYVASAVVDTRTGDRTQLARTRQDRVLVTTPVIVAEREKRRLAQAYGATMVDMEAATIARLAQMRGIPMMAIKAISDEVTARLPDFNPFLDPAAGRLRMRSFTSHVAFRPVHWRPLIHMGRASSKGARALASSLQTFLSGPKDVQRANETGSTDWQEG